MPDIYDFSIQEMFQKEKVDAAQMEEDFTKLIRFWKSLYQRS